MVSKDKKQKLVVFCDIGLVGTLVRVIDIDSEPEYCMIEYVPLNNRMAKKYKYPYRIRKEHLYNRVGSKDLPGVQDDILYIITAEPGSHVGSIFSELKKQVEDLRRESRNYKMKSASDSLDAENARSGVAKTIESMNDATKSRRGIPSHDFNDPFGRSPIPRPIPNDFEGNNY